MKRLREEQGQSLIVVLALVLIATIIGVGLLTSALSSSSTTTHDSRTRQALQAADAGIQHQVYEQSDENSEGYNVTGGVLGISNVLDCVVPVLNSAGQIVSELTGVVQLSGGTGCAPSSTQTTCTTTCSPLWFPAGNNNYYQSEFLQNATGQGSTSSGYQIDFPEVVALGCNTSGTGVPGTPSNCIKGGYSRELAYLQPTTPLQSVEGENNVTIESAQATLSGDLTTTLTSTLTTLLQPTVQSQIGCYSVLLGGTLCIVTGVLTGVSSVLSGVLDGNLPAGLSSAVSTVLESTLDALPGGLSTATVLSKVLTATVASALSGLLAVLPTNLAAVDGNITAGNNLYLPAETIDLNTSDNSTSLFGLLGNLVSLQPLTGLTTLPSGLAGTDEYGANVCNSAATGASATAIPETPNPPSTSCSPSSSATAAAAGLLAVGANLVKASGLCTANQTSNASACIVPRPSFTVSSPPTASVASICTGCSYSTTGTSAYDLTIPASATITFTTGTYVFCGITAASTSTVKTSSTNTGAVQVFILSPNSSYCLGDTGSQGNVTIPAGVNDTLGVGLSVNGVTSTVVPSAFQLYVAGDPSTTLTVGGSTQPTTSVSIGNSTSSTLTQAYVVYAPRSNVTVTTGATFTGSLVGWNTTLTALAILQDLDLGNYPLSSVANTYQIQQTVQCNASVTALTDSSSDTAGC